MASYPAEIFFVCSASILRLPMDGREGARPLRQAFRGLGRDRIGYYQGGLRRLAKSSARRPRQLAGTVRQVA